MFHALTRGIILKRRNLGEADRVLIIFTEKLGKVTAKARGVRKPLSKLAGHLEPFTLTQFHLAEGKTWYTVTEAAILISFAAIRHNLELTSSAYVMVESIDHLLQDDEPHPDVFSLLIKTFELLSSGVNPHMLLPAFIIGLLGSLGYRPELYKCVAGGEKIEPAHLYFSLSLGGLLDEAHKQKDPNALPVSPETVKLLRISLRNSELLGKIKVSEKIVQEFTQTVYDFSEHVLERQPKSLKFLKVVYANMD